MSNAFSLMPVSSLLMFSDEKSADVFLDWALCLPTSFWWAQLVFPEVSPDVYCQICLTGATRCLPRSIHNLSSGICLMDWCVLLMSVWTELCVCQCLSSELSRCLPKVSPDVFCQIYLQEPLDVFQDQPTIFLPVSVWWVDAFYLSWFSSAFCQCLPDENPANVCLDWALRLPVSFWWESG